MPGPYGRVFSIGEDITNSPREVRSGQCVRCGKEVYREVYTYEKGWFWRHYSCDPVKPVVERRYARSDKGADYKPMGYVPECYPFERGIAEDPDGTCKEFTPKGGRGGQPQ